MYIPLRLYFEGDEDSKIIVISLKLMMMRKTIIIKNTDRTLNLFPTLIPFPQNKTTDQAVYPIHS